MDKVISGIIWSGFNSARLDLRCTNWPLCGPGHPWETSLSNSGPLRASQGMIRSVRVELGHLKAILVLWGTLQVSMNMNLSISEPNFVLQISQSPNIAQKWFCIPYIWILVFRRKKNDLEICSLIPEILNKQAFERFFLKRPVYYECLPVWVPRPCKYNGYYFSEGTRNSMFDIWSNFSQVWD